MLINLSNSVEVAIIDDKHFDRVKKHTWFLKQVDPYSNYVATSFRQNGKVKTVYLHRFILNAGRGMDVHHRNKNSLDNREENLSELQGRLHRIWHKQGEI